MNNEIKILSVENRTRPHGVGTVSIKLLIQMDRGRITTIGPCGTPREGNYTDLGPGLERAPFRPEQYVFEVQLDFVDDVRHISGEVRRKDVTTPKWIPKTLRKRKRCRPGNVRAPPYAG
jgi:hypothetical protein